MADFVIEIPNLTPSQRLRILCVDKHVDSTIPAKAAMEMLLTGHPISAQRAHELGLVNDVVEASNIDARIASIVDAVVASSPAVVALGKRATEGMQPAEPRPFA